MKNLIDTITETTLNELEKTLLTKALEASQNAYAPYSKYHVGSALITEKGNVFLGCNVENDSYGLCICGERNALTTAIAQEGPSMRLKAIAAVVVGPDDQFVNDGSPCGACRQFMAQFGENAEVIYRYGGEFHTHKVKDLLLNPFIIPQA